MFEVRPTTSEFLINSRAWALYRSGRPKAGYVCPRLALKNCETLATNELADAGVSTWEAER